MFEVRGPLVLVDGWYTDDPDEFRFYTREASTFGYGRQVARDVRGLAPWCWWLLLCVAPVLFLGWWGLAIALPALGAYLHMIRTIVSGYRRSVLVEGQVSRFDRTHPLFRGHRAGELRPAGGRPLPPEPVTATLPAQAVEAFAQTDGSLEVLVSHVPDAMFSPVIGIRNPRGLEAAR